MIDIVVAFVLFWNLIVGVDNCMNLFVFISCLVTDTVVLYCLIIV